MIKFKPIILPFIAFILTAGFASAQDCARALIQDGGIINLEEFHSLSRAELLRRSLGNDKNWAAGMTVQIDGVPITGNAERAESAREEYFSSSHLNWTSERLVSAATQNLSRNAVEAYRACIDGQHSSGPRIFVHDATRTEATVTVKYFAPPGANPQTDNVQISISGGSFAQDFPDTWVNGGSFASIVSRDPDQDMRVVANIGAESDNVFVSLIPKAPPPQLPAIIVAYCVGKGGQNGVHLWGPNGDNCNGLPPGSGWGKYDGARQEITQMGSCIGQGGFDGVKLWGPVGEACGGIPNNAWGTYGVEEIVNVKSTGLGFCVGGGNVLGGHVLWGPKGYPCAGFPTWGNYN